MRKFFCELLVLLWAIQHCDMDNIPTMIHSWKVISPDERLKLYIATKKARADCVDEWREVLRFALEVLNFEKSWNDKEI